MELLAPGPAKELVRDRCDRLFQEKLQFAPEVDLSRILVVSHNRTNLIAVNPVLSSEVVRKLHKFHS
jgi:hypothetical protein